MLPFVLECKILPVLLACILQVCARAGLRVVGGKDVAEDHLPYIVRMEIRYTIAAQGQPMFAFLHICTAAALSANWMLTAAHCVDGSYEFLAVLKKIPNATQPITIVRYSAPYGAPTEKDGFSQVIASYYHPSYRMMVLGLRQVVRNDVALLQTFPVQLPQFARVSALEFSTLTGQGATAAGFGLTRMGEVVASTMMLAKPLQVTKVVIKTCDDRKLISLYPNMCVSGRCNEGAALCPGDSGGPLIHASGIVGINSMANPFDCDINQLKKGKTSNIVGVITPISPYIDWIGDVIRRHGNREAPLVPVPTY